MSPEAGKYYHADDDYFMAVRDSIAKSLAERGLLARTLRDEDSDTFQAVIDSAGLRLDEAGIETADSLTNLEALTSLEDDEGKDGGEAGDREPLVPYPGNGSPSLLRAAEDIPED